MLRPNITVPLALALALVTAACGGGSERKPPPLTDSSKVLEEGTQQMAAGKCDQAVPYLYHLADQGQGFEIAQYRLGKCRLTQGGGDPNSDATLDGLLWMRRAAGGGQPEAQGDLAIFYTEGPAKLRDPVEAAMWLAIYESNGRRHLVGFNPMPVATLRQLKDTLGDANLAEGQKRANAWRQIPWNPPDRVLKPTGAGGQRFTPPPADMGGPTGQGGKEPGPALPPLLPQKTP